MTPRVKVQCKMGEALDVKFQGHALEIDVLDLVAPTRTTKIPAMTPLTRTLLTTPEILQHLQFALVAPPSTVYTSQSLHPPDRLDYELCGILLVRRDTSTGATLALVKEIASDRVDLHSVHRRLDFDPMESVSRCVSRSASGILARARRRQWTWIGTQRLAVLE